MKKEKLNDSELENINGGVTFTPGITPYDANTNGKAGYLGNSLLRCSCGKLVKSSGKGFLPARAEFGYNSGQAEKFSCPCGNSYLVFENGALVKDQVAK